MMAELVHCSHYRYFERHLVMSVLFRDVSSNICQASLSAFDVNSFEVVNKEGRKEKSRNCDDIWYSTQVRLFLQRLCLQRPQADFLECLSFRSVWENAVMIGGL